MVARRGYNVAQIALHWIVAALVIFNYVYSDDMGKALRDKLRGTETAGLKLDAMIHVWVGVALLVLVILRLVLRRVRGAPPAPGSGLPQRAALWGHRLLYALLVAVPFLGALTWFAGLRQLGDAHELLASVLLWVAGGHALIALFHHYVLKDGLLTRMARPE